VGSKKYSAYVCTAGDDWCSDALFLVCVAWFASLI